MTFGSQNRRLGAAFAAGGLGLILAAGAWAQDVSTMVSPPKSVRTTDKSTMVGAWETWSGRNDPAHPPAPASPPPLKPEFQAKLDAQQRAIREANANHVPLATGNIDCLPNGFPAMMRAGFPMEILVTPGQVTMIQEAFTQIRRIYLDEAPGVPGDVEPVWYGHSVGHWEGKTLVVDTIGVKAGSVFQNVPHSDQMRVAERISLTEPDWLRDDMVITDPEYLTGPWKVTWIYKRNAGYKVQEYVCEANRYTDIGGVQTYTKKLP